MKSTVRRVASARVPTKWGDFKAIGFEQVKPDGSGEVETALALVLGDPAAGIPLVRLHSQCLTGESFRSFRCDCGEQLDKAMDAIGAEQRGVLIYEHQEGRGIGLMAKLQAYSLQDQGLDTVEANRTLGFADDERDYSFSIEILGCLGVKYVRVLTNNPGKVSALGEGGIEVVEQVSCEVKSNSHSLSYLQTKKAKMGHSLILDNPEMLEELGTTGEQSLPPEEAPSYQFASIEEAIQEYQAGRMIVVVDDEDRENEGDLAMAAEKITPEAVNFMATHGRGLICVAMTEERLQELEIGSMAPENDALGGTAFTVSIDVKGDDVSTGISANDRAKTIAATVDPNIQPADFARPGHVFPLRARRGGVLERRGQTEAAVDLAKLAGLQPAGVICEIVNDDGTMSRVPDLMHFCKKHDLLIITVADLARYRFDHEVLEMPESLNLSYAAPCLYAGAMQ